MKGHKKHDHHPHDHMAAMPEFNKPHWEKNVSEVDSMETRYCSEMGACEEYKKQVDGLVNYAKKHRAQH